MRAADRGRDRRGGLGRVRALLPGPGGLRIADVVRLIKTLITAAHVAGFDETRCGAGPPGAGNSAGGRHRAVLAVFLGARTLESFRDFGILPAFAGVVVSDRYANYFHKKGWEHIAGNQACLAHLIRDFQDAAECYPPAIWPVQARAGTARPDPRLACRP